MQTLGDYQGRGNCVTGRLGAMSQRLRLPILRVQHPEWRPCRMPTRKHWDGQIISSLLLLFINYYSKGICKYVNIQGRVLIHSGVDDTRHQFGRKTNIIPTLSFFKYDLQFLQHAWGGGFKKILYYTYYIII